MKNATIKLKWAFHNIVGHPLYGLATLVGLESLGDYIHEATHPDVVFGNLREANKNSSNYGKRARIKATEGYNK